MQQIMKVRCLNDEERDVAASYAKRSFCDGEELLERCTVEMAKSFGNENLIESYETVSSSRRTISKRFK